MARDVGRLGEAFFRMWADQAGLIVNNSNNHDASGWDFFLEWPRSDRRDEEAVSIPHDLRPAPLQALVQVKSSDSSAWRVPVSLSNWLRLAQTGFPCFFVILEFDGGDTCQRAFIVHVNGDWVRRVLKRVRELSVRKPPAHLHKHTLSVTWSSSDSLTPLNGHGLADAIQRRIGGTLEDYLQRKLRVIKTAGYEGGGKRLRMRVRPPDDWAGDPRDLLMDLYLGLVPFVHLEGGEIIDQRFGIPAPGIEKQLAPGRLEMAETPSIGEARVRLVAPKIERRLDIFARTYVPPRNVGQNDRKKARFAAPFLDLVWSLTNHDISFHTRLPDPTALLPLADLQPVAEFILLMEAAQKRQSEIEVRVFLEREELEHGRLVPTTAPSAPLVAWSNLVQGAWTVANFFDLKRDVAVRVTELARSNGPLVFMNAVLRRQPGFVRGEFTVPSVPDNPDNLWCLPLVVTAHLAEYSAQVGAVAVGHPIQIGDGVHGPRYFLETNDVRLDAHRLFIAPEKPEQSDADLATAIAAKYSADMNVVIVRDDER